MKKFATKLAQAKGHGSAKSGVHHWWAQRISAVVLVPLLLWFIIGTAMYGPSCTYEAWVNWLVEPLSLALMTSLVGAGLYHGQLGMQVIIEDYVHDLFWRLTLLFINKIVALGACVAFIVSLIKIVVNHAKTGQINAVL